jgi:hypothetical protein
VEFIVENAEVNLLEQEPGPDGKVDPAKIAPFPIPLSQVQKTLNTTATLRLDGSVSGIQGGDTSAIKIDFGIDLRKLFLVTAPITFANRPVKTGDEWPFTDGLLGSKPGKTTYTGRLAAISGNGKSIAATVTQQAESVVDSKLDKDGNSTDNAGAAVGSLVGTVTLTGTARLAGLSDGSGAAAGRVSNANMSMVASLKRTLPDPDQAGKQQVTDIDIRARLIVKPLAAKPTGAAAEKVASSAHKAAAKSKVTVRSGTKQ